MKVDIEKIIEIIVREVITELTKLGVDIELSYVGNKKISSPNAILEDKREVIDMSGYKTPVLTENHLISLDSNKVEIVVPKGTVLTPGARDIIRKRKLKLTNK